MNRHDKRSQSRQQQVTVSHAQKVWNYPVPPPEELSQYSEEMQKLFSKEWEKEADHRRSMDREVLRVQEIDIRAKSFDVRATRSGDILGLILSWLMVMGFGTAAIYFVYIGRDIQALGTFAASIMTYFTLKKK